MRLDFPQPFRNFAKPSLIFLCFVLQFVGFTGVTLAKAPVAAATQQGNALTELVMTGDKGSELQLEVRQMPLAKVLEAIAKQTHVPIHYSVLPEGLVTATCVGTTLKRVLECLLDRKADLIVRYPRSNLAKADDKGQVSEAWVLGSRLEGSSVNRADCAATAGQADKGSLVLQQKQQDAEAESDRTDDLLKMAKSASPAERVDAIGALLAEGRKGDPDVKAALEQALTDQDENVRAQAISTLAHREGSDAVPAIREALNDSSVDVRMMAVDGITDDVALLQQAVNDSDETVRSLANVKLQELTQSNGNGSAE
jgi:hypothetical protein